jgi:hypothetical protein
MPDTPAVITGKTEVSTDTQSWADKMKGLVKRTKEAEKPQGGFISLKGGRMTYNDEILPGDKINAVIIDYRMEQALYDQKYDAKNPRSPICFAVVQPGEDLRPHKDSEDPKCDRCEDCDYNQWNSAPLLDYNEPTSRGKACKGSRRLHILAADDLVDGPDAVEKASVMTMIPPSTSLDNFQRCMNKLSNVLEKPCFGAIIEISVKPHDRFLYMVHYNILKTIDDEVVLDALMKKHEKVAAREVTYPKNDERDPNSHPRAQSSKF